MRKVKLYPRTNRTGKEKDGWQITEKLDGSNIGFFKLNGELYVAQRNRVYLASEVAGFGTYPGLQAWLEMFGEHLTIALYEGAAIFGEWLAQGRLKYNIDEMGRFHMFTKARIDESLDLTNWVYDLELLHYAFMDQEIPAYVKLVPLVATTEFGKPSIETLDEIYDIYLEEVGRDVEGFVISNARNFEKYIRNVGRGIQDFKPNGRKNEK